MKKITLLSLFIAFTMICCQEDECRRCTGTVTNTGETADWTVCDNDGNIIRVNNLTDDAQVTENTLPESVAFFEELGLECN